MEIYLHDDSRLIDEKGAPNRNLYDPVTFAPNHGHRGHTHAGTVRVDYEYQVEMWVSEIQSGHPYIMRIECPEIEREWKRIDGKFVEQK
jgi:hypothetical protein